jgi:hypothetical protein
VTDNGCFGPAAAWFMGCVSGGTESDTGTMYPTVVEDTNGNLVQIAYMPGIGTSWPNSSARISTITDVRAQGGLGYIPPSSTFSYGSNGAGDPIRHLDTIRNSVGTSENFNFYTNTGASFVPPFSGASALPNTTNLVYLMCSTTRVRREKRSGPLCRWITNWTTHETGW